MQQLDLNLNGRQQLDKSDSRESLTSSLKSLIKINSSSARL
jgi:hypothetical protein